MDHPGNQIGNTLPSFHSSLYILTSLFLYFRSLSLFVSIPTSSWFWKRANSFQVGDDFLQRQWKAIPDDVDILMTHVPPYGIKDQEYRGSRLGCPYLLQTHLRIRPQVIILSFVSATVSLSIYLSFHISILSVNLYLPNTSKISITKYYTPLDIISSITLLHISSLL